MVLAGPQSAASASPTPASSSQASQVPTPKAASSPDPPPPPPSGSGSGSGSGEGGRHRLAAVRRGLRPGVIVTGLRARAGTTPGLLRLWSIVLVGTTALLWVVSFSVAVARQNAVEELRGSASVTFAASQRIHADLSEADATVARAFLALGAEPPEQRAAFARSIDSATRDVVALARAGGPAEVQEPLAVLASQIPVYTGLVERARANNRAGFVVGAAYLRQASELMHGTILPAAGTLTSVEAERIDRAYAQATHWYHPVLVTAAGVLTLAALVAVQLLLFRRTRRVFNVPLVAATLVAVVALGLTLTALSVERARLADGRDHGFVPMTIVSQARVLALRAWGDESLALVARGNGAVHEADADAVTARLGYAEDGRPTGSGVLAEATELGGPDAGTRDGLDEAWIAYHATSRDVRRLLSEVGGFQEGVDRALGEGSDTFDRFDEAAVVAITASQDRFDARLSSAGDSLAGLAGGVTGAFAVVALLSLAGVQLRINEYR